MALFIAALPFAWGEAAGSIALWLGLAVAGGLAVLALARGDRVDRFEVALSALALALTIALSLWRFDRDVMDTANLPPGAWARAVFAVVAYLFVASGYRARRDAGHEPSHVVGDGRPGHLRHRAGVRRVRSDRVGCGAVPHRRFKCIWI